MSTINNSLIFWVALRTSLVSFSLRFHFVVEIWETMDGTESEFIYYLAGIKKKKRFMWNVDFADNWIVLIYKSRRESFSMQNCWTHLCDMTILCIVSFVALYAECWYNWCTSMDTQWKSNPKCIPLFENVKGNHLTLLIKPQDLWKLLVISVYFPRYNPSPPPPQCTLMFRVAVYMQNTFSTISHRYWFEIPLQRENLISTNNFSHLIQSFSSSFLLYLNYPDESNAQRSISSSSSSIYMFWMPSFSYA